LISLEAGDVLLRPYKESDRGPLVAILGEPELMRLVLDERPFTPLDAEAFIAENFLSGERAGYGTVCLKTTDEPIGFSGFRTCRYLNSEDVEFGWVLARAHHGRGYATALGQRLIAYALGSWRLTRVLAGCNPANHASEHILREKLRMRFERDVEPRPGFHRRVYSAQLTR
jgi:[ribosomal protein S5]-alanine N-acetyltransferase